MTLLGLRFSARAFSNCGKWGPLFIAVRGPLTIAASLLAEHRLQTRRLSSCGSRAQLLRGMWAPPRPGLEPVSPALAGRFSTTAPPGKPFSDVLLEIELCRVPRCRSKKPTSGEGPSQTAVGWHQPLTSLEEEAELEDEVAYPASHLLQISKLDIQSLPSH